MALRIGIDVDGVIADFRTAFHAAAVRCLRRDVEDSDDLESGGPVSPEDVRRVWDSIARTENWWMDVPPHEPEQIARLYRLTRANGWEVYFLTKRPPSAGDSVQFQTQWWIERFGFYLPAVLTVSGSRADVANGLRLDIVVDDQIVNCIEVISAAPIKALLMLRSSDPAGRDYASSRGIGVVSSLSEGIAALERAHDVLPQRGRLKRLSEWFSVADEKETLPANPRAARPIPPYDPRR
jgi:hypothetical protein